MKRLLWIVLASCVCFSLASFINPRPESPDQIISKMLAKVKGVNTAIFTLEMNERIDGKLVAKSARFKISTTPVKVYLKQDYPNKDMEILYVEGRNRGRALISPKSFPYVTLNLDPVGNSMRNGHHNSVIKAGFEYLVQTVEHLFKKYENKLSEMLKYEGMVRYSGEICHKIVFENPGFAFISYSIKEGENLEKLSWKLFVSDYMIMEANPQLKSFDGLKPGSVIKIPNDFARTFVLYIARDSYIPVGIKTYDNKGLFHEYIYKDVVLNPPLTDLDFDRNNPDYRF